MVEKDPIDDLLKNKMQERHFSPGPDDWRDMEVLLDKHMPVKRKKRWLWLWFCAPVLLSVAAVFVWSEGAGPDNKQERGNHSTTVVTDLNQPEPGGPGRAGKATTTEQGKQKNLAGRKETERTDAATSVSSLQQNSSSLQKATDKPSGRKPLIRASKKITPVVVTSFESKDGTPDKESSQPKLLSDANENLNEKVTKNLSENKEVKTDSVSSALPKPDEVAVAQNKHDTTATATDSTAKKTSDSLENTVASSASKKPQANPDKKFTLALSAGVQGWKTSKEIRDTFYSYQNYNYTPAFNLGLQGTYKFNPHWSLSAGTQYSVHTRLEEVKNYEVRNYSFGSTYSQLTVATTRLHYLQVPVEVQYHFGKRHTVLAGVQMDRLLNSVNTLRLNTSVFPGGQDTLNPFTSTSSTSKGSGYTNGFRQTSWSLALGYGISFGDRWFIMTKAQYGLTDNTINKYFGNRDINRNTGIQFIVRYNIIRF